MEGRGRRSVASLAVITSIPGQRPEPPESLAQAEADVWRAIAATKPHDWWSADTFPLLEEYCRAAISANDVAKELAKFTKIPARGERFRRYLALRKLQDQTARLLASLATKMRLSQQSRYGARGASTAHDRSGQGATKPWEFGKGG
jgi:hypothetical protein